MQVKVKLPSGIRAICSHLFEGCVNLTGIAILDGVEDIVYCAFKGCTSLSEVRIPNSVEEIGKKAFSRCAKGFVLQSSNPKWKAYALEEGLKFELIDAPYVK